MKIADIRNWDDVYLSPDALSDLDRAEIALGSEIIGAIISGCKARGYTQEELEKEAGVESGTVIGLVNSNHFPLSTILKILHPFGKTLAVVPLSKGPSGRQRTTL